MILFEEKHEVIQDGVVIGFIIFDASSQVYLFDVSPQADVLSSPELRVIADIINELQDSHKPF